MKQTKAFCAAMIAMFGLMATLPANAAFVRAFWTGVIDQAVAGNPLELAVGDKLSAQFFVDSDQLTSMLAGAETTITADAVFYMPASNPFVVSTAGSTPSFTAQILLTGGGGWTLSQDASLVATGDWNTPDIKMASRVIPIPAALPLFLGALGLIAGLRRR